MASICHCSGPQLLFLKIFSFQSLISSFVSLQSADQLCRESRERHYGWTGSNWMPINTFQREAKWIRPQLGVFSRMIIERLKTAGLKSSVFYYQQTNGRSFVLTAVAFLSVDVDSWPYFPPLTPSPINCDKLGAPQSHPKGHFWHDCAVS